MFVFDVWIFLVVSYLFFVECIWKFGRRLECLGFFVYLEVFKFLEGLIKSSYVFEI